jgi:hypothetical protein
MVIIYNSCMYQPFYKLKTLFTLALFQFFINCQHEKISANSINYLKHLNYGKPEQ